MTVEVASGATQVDSNASAGRAKSNRDVIAAIRAHHAQLAAELHERTAAALAAAQHDEGTAARDALHNWYRTELMPHVVAEEQALYSSAAELEPLRLLVRGMLNEHRALVSLVAELALASQAFRAATIAAAAQALFDVHLSKENDLLLPALDGAGLDLGALLAGMHAILGAAAGHGGCGCGSDHDGEPDDTAPALVQISSQPDWQPGQPAIVPAAAGAGELDVRTLPHGQRHEIIFGRLDALAPGEALVIVNDHDPKPLRYQTAALWPDRFEWTYREAGPQVWRVAITRAD